MKKTEQHRLAELLDALYWIYYDIAEIRDGADPAEFIKQIDSTIQKIEMLGYVLKEKPEYARADAILFAILDCLSTIEDARHWRKLETYLLQASQALWPLIYKPESKPKHLISAAVAVKEFSISRATIKRLIAEGKLKTYRKSSHKNAPHLIDAVEIAALYPRRK